MKRLRYRMWPETIGMFIGLGGSLTLVMLIGGTPAPMWWAPFVGSMLAWVILAITRIVCGLPIFERSGG